MTLQLSVAVRNDMLDAIEAEIGTGPVLRIFSGGMPANAAAASSGTLLAEMTLPADWLTAAASGVKSKTGIWSDLSANASGTAGYFRIFESTGTTCHIQGVCTDSAGAGPMKLSTTTVTATEPVTVASFTLTAPNA